MRSVLLLLLMIPVPGAAATAPGLADSAAVGRGPVAPSPRAEIKLSDDLVLREIGDGAFVVAHRFPGLCNSALVEMADGTLVLAGTPCTADATRELLRWARARWGERRVVAINNGYHYDNLGGNEALLAAGVAVYGSDLTVRLLAERGEATRALTLRLIGGETSRCYRALAEQRYHAPDHVFRAADGLTLMFGGEQVRVIYPGPTQAPDKVLIYFPARKLLYGGCALIGGPRLGNMAEANVSSWLAAVRDLRALAVEVAIPAHSPNLAPTVLANTEALLAAASR
ncbi:MBL fold metallo-hydrolase [Opitutus sp. ER46]|uniref:MBL fold metallo-hydrolase n=1 Tax=Opitutus sp. ER46 TaxID=2161864 RepID=UPI0011B1C930|nr:MBL fold metallo-hydrolase [Opitutus sp. ER46]